MGCVIVTGAVGGIGQALVRTFAEAGHPVIGADIAAQPDDLPVDRFIQCDLTRTVEDPAYAAEVFSSIRTALKGRPLDALINNAAVQILGKIEDLDRAGWRNTLHVNLLAPFFWTQAFLSELESSAGCVINISSIHARLTKPSFVAYATSKAALSGMTRAMAIDAGYRVRIYGVEPAAIDTQMLREGFSHNSRKLQSLIDHHPAGTIGTPSDLASIALFLCRQKTQFLTGTVVQVDGAISACLHDPDCVFLGASPTINEVK